MFYVGDRENDKVNFNYETINFAFLLIKIKIYSFLLVVHCFGETLLLTTLTLKISAKLLFFMTYFV